MRRTTVLASLLILAVAVGFVSIGMAYTASTENSGNDLSSDYVVLYQTNYTFSENDDSFNKLVLSIMSSDVGTFYQISGVESLEPTFNGRIYYGLKIGTDTLGIKAVGNGHESPLKVSVKTFSDGFNDFSDQTFGWRYVMKIVGKDSNLNTFTQYAYYDGEPPADNSDDQIGWKVLKKVNDEWVRAEDDKLTIYFGEGIDPYQTTLYFAGIRESVVEGMQYMQEGDSFLAKGDVKIKAVWSMKAEGDHKITLDPGVGTGIEVSTYISDGASYLLPTPEEAKFTSPAGEGFAGWLSSSGRNYTPGEEAVNVKNDTTFTAIWAETVTVKVSAGEGTGADIITTPEPGTEYTFLDPVGHFTPPTGKSFMRWAATIGDNYTAYFNPGDKIKVTNGMNIVAEYGYKITFDPEDLDHDIGTGTMKPIIAEPDSYVIIPNSEFQHPEGEKYFEHWHLTESLKYDPGVEIRVTKEMVLHACWHTGVKCTITFNGNTNTGTKTMSPVELLKGAKYVLPECGFEKTGPNDTTYSFVRWEIGDNRFMPGDVILVESNIEVKAIWVQNVNVVVYKDSSDIVTDQYKVATGARLTLRDNQYLPSQISQYSDLEWKFKGWLVMVADKWSSTPWNIIQSLTNPVNAEGYVINNGVIKFIYENNNVQNTLNNQG